MLGPLIVVITFWLMVWAGVAAYHWCDNNGHDTAALVLQLIGVTFLGWCVFAGACNADIYSLTFPMAIR
jgi:hypothetical protein